MSEQNKWKHYNFVVKISQKKPSKLCFLKINLFTSQLSNNQIRIIFMMKKNNKKSDEKTRKN